MRCTSRGRLVARLTNSTMNGPMLMFGTNMPSITSTCMKSAPASSAAFISSPSLRKSAERMDGDILTVIYFLPPMVNRIVSPRLISSPGAGACLVMVAEPPSSFTTTLSPRSAATSRASRLFMPRKYGQ